MKIGRQFEFAAEVRRAGWISGFDNSPRGEKEGARTTAQRQKEEEAPGTGIQGNAYPR